MSTAIEALEELRAGRKHILYDQVRAELAITLSDVELYRAAGPHVSTVAEVTRKLHQLPDAEVYRLRIARPPHSDGEGSGHGSA